MDKHALIADAVTTNTRAVEIPGKGTVVVRGLSRFEMIYGQRLGEKDNLLEQEQFILACAMIDPPMTKDDVAAWQRNSLPNEINAVAMVINELSGLVPGADKEAYKSI